MKKLMFWICTACSAALLVVLVIKTGPVGLICGAALAVTSVVATACKVAIDLEEMNK